MSDDVSVPVAAARPGHWDALRDPAFVGIWSAGAVAICVIWMQDVGAQWLMKELSGADALRVSLVQTFGLLPVVLFALPAGALSDIVGHRRLLFGAFAWTAAWSLWLALGSLRGGIDPNGLLLVVLALGVGKALILPSFAAACAEAAMPTRLESAVGLHSLANNAGRVLGPASAGVLVATLSMATLFGTAGVVMLCALALLWRATPVHPRIAASRSPVGERGYFGAIVDGLALAIRAREVRNVIVRSFGYFLSAVAVHALLPLLSQQPQWFGAGWAAYGIGAIVGALGYPAFSRAVPLPRQLAFAVFGHAAMLGALALLPSDAARAACLFALGFAWYVVIQCMQVALQRALPDAMRARGSSFFAITLSGAFMIGAPIWGWLAASLGVSAGLMVAAVVSAGFLAVTCRLPIEAGRLD